MRNELGEDVDGLLEVFVIPQGHAHAEGHVENAQDDGDLHFEGVQKDNLKK